MSTMEELQSILSFLNASPYNLNLTLVQLDTKSSHDLLQIVATTCFELDPTQKSHIDTNGSTESLAQSITKFVKLLNYEPSKKETFASDLKSGKKDMILHLLNWLLTEKKHLKTRAYVARFMCPYDLPQEFLVDPVLNELYAQLQGCQSRFKDVHSQSINANTASHTSNDNSKEEVANLKREIRTIRNEEEQLQNKLSKMKNKIESDSTVANNRDKFHQILQATSSLRSVQEEEVLLYDRGNEQRRQHRLNQKTMHIIHHSKNDLQAIFNDEDMNEMDIETLLQSWDHKIAENEATFNHLCNEYEETYQLLQESISIAHSDPIPQHEIESLQSHVHSLQTQIQQLEKQRDSLLQAVDSKLGFYKKRAMNVRKKKDAATNRLRQIQDEIKDVRTEILNYENKMDKLSINGKRPMSESELKEYMAVLSEKKSKYLELKHKLQSKSHEISILQRTNEILQSRDEHLDEYLTMKRNKANMADQKRILEKMSAAKSDIDHTKEQTLDSLSAVVKRINAELKLKKNRLAPLIKKFRARREKFQEFEAEYKDKKQVYDNMKSGYDVELEKLEAMVEKNRGTGESLESKCSQMKSDIDDLHLRKEKIAKEEEYQKEQSDERLNESFKSYQEMYEHQIAQLIKKSKTLRHENKIVGERHGNNMEQRAYFVKAKALMEAKKWMVEGRIQQVTMHDDHVDGADRMVLTD